MKNSIKAAQKIVVVILALSFACVLLTGCGHTLSGKYSNESGKYTIVFDSGNKCTWYQDNTFFDGEYHWDDEDDCYHIEIEGHGFYLDTVFTAESADDGLIINGGTVDNELFKPDDSIKVRFGVESNKQSTCTKVC